MAFSGNASEITWVALVTGSTRELGIGLGIARCLAKKGTAIILHGTRKAESDEVKKCRADLAKEYGVSVHYVQADLSTSDGATELCEKVDKIYPDGIDILVNNAGISQCCLLQDLSLEKWNIVISTMLTAPFLLMKHFLPRMKKRGWGRIVNISSVFGLRGKGVAAGYCSAKHGILGLTKAVALETAGSGVTCNAICPGWVATDIYWNVVDKKMKKDGISKEEAEAIVMTNPSKEIVSAEQIGEAVCYFCSRGAVNTTGTSLCIDGGHSAQ